MVVPDSLYSKLGLQHLVLICCPLTGIPSPYCSAEIEQFNDELANASSRLRYRSPTVPVRPTLADTVRADCTLDCTRALRI